MAAALAPVELGQLHDPHGGVPDLDAGVVRVLHYRSFVDDPTRLLRAVRYEVRLGFAMDPDTEELAREAVAGGALSTVSGPRVRDELLGLLGEPDPAAGAERLRMLGIDRGLHPALAAGPDLVAGAVLGAAETGADRVLAALAALVASDPEGLSGWLGDLGVDRATRERVMRAARPRTGSGRRAAGRPSAVPPARAPVGRAAGGARAGARAAARPASRCSATCPSSAG